MSTAEEADTTPLSVVTAGVVESTEVPIGKLEDIVKYQKEIRRKPSTLSVLKFNAEEKEKGKRKNFRK